MSDGFTDFSFDQGDEKVTKKNNRFKAKEGETYRMSLVWLRVDDEGNPNWDKPIRFTGCERHYLAGVGYFLHKGPEYSKLAGGPPKQQVACICIVWPTLARGKLDKEKFAKGEDVEVYWWGFSSEKYDQIKLRNDNYPLTENDLVVNCTDTQYQKMDISTAPGNLFRKLWESDKPHGRKMAEALWEQIKEMEDTLRAEIARDLTLEQIREKLGGSGGGPVPEGASAEDVDGLLDNLLDD